MLLCAVNRRRLLSIYINKTKNFHFNYSKYLNNEFYLNHQNIYNLQSKSKLEYNVHFAASKL